MINYSFIIPHHNSPDLLNRLLNSIPQRDDIEIIVVDDNSNTNKKPKIDRTDVKTIFVSAEESKGAGRARNIGIKEATGKWLLFADADDYYINSFVCKLDYYKDSEYDIVFFDYDTNHNSGSTLFSTRLDNMLKGNKRDRANFKHMSNAPWNKMYKRQFVIVNDIQFEEVPIQNDAYFVHKAASLTDNFHYINEKLYFYEINDHGITRKKRRKEDWECNTTTRIKVDKLKAQSGAWDCISLFYGRKLSIYGSFFAIKLQLRRIKHGLLWYMTRRYLS